MNELEKANLIKVDEDYSIAEEHEEGFFNLLTLNLYALFRKRFFMYKRSYKTFIVEVFIPLILVIIGFGLSKVSFFYS